MQIFNNSLFQLSVILLCLSVAMIAMGYAISTWKYIVHDLFILVSNKIHSEKLKRAEIKREKEQIRIREQKNSPGHLYVLPEDDAPVPDLFPAVENPDDSDGLDLYDEVSK